MRTCYKVLLGAIPLLLGLLPTVRTQAQTYCTPAYSTGCTSLDDINTFTLVGASSTSFNQVGTGCAAGAYANYTTLPAVNLVPGNTYSGTINSSYQFGSEYVRIWIDFNNDGYLDSTATSTEAVAAFGPIDTALVPYSFSIPLTATPGLRRMRVRLVFAPTSASAINPCQSYTWGETHDYTVNIVALTPCSGTPSPAGQATTSAATPCAGSSITISLPNGPVAGNLSYALQSSTTSATTGFGANIATSATPFFNVTSVPGTTWYRIVTTCTNTGGGSVNSDAVQVTVPGLFPGGTYTINNSQPTGGTNYNSFTDAVNAISCGIAGPVIFNVANNATPYTEQINIPHIATTSSANTVTFNGNGATLQHNSGTAQPAVVTLNGADWIRFKRLTIRGLNSTNNTGVQLINDANYNLIDSCTIALDSNGTSFSTAGISMSGSLTSPSTSGSNCDSNTITNNTVIGGYFGITVFGNSSSTSTYNRGNVVSNNVIKNFYIYGVYGAYITNTLFEGNDISRPTRSSYTTFYGIYVFTSSGGIHMRRNRIHDPAGTQPNAVLSAYCLSHSSVTGTAANPNEVSNNLVYNMRHDGAMYGLYNITSPHTKYYHNTLSLDDTTAVTAGVTRAFYQSGSSAGIEIKNNIFSLRRGGGGDRHAVYFATTIGTSNPYSARNNVYYVPNAIGLNGVAYYNGTNYALLAPYQAASLQDTGTVAVNPAFTQPGGSTVASYTPLSASVNNIGIPLAAVTTDILTNPRSTTAPDPGAVEFTPGACSNPPTAGTIIASDSAVCAGTTVALDVVGNSQGLGQTYQWQSAASAAGPYTAIGTPTGLSTYSQAITATTYFRVAVTCGSSTSFSDTQMILVVTPLAGGTYTINSGLPASATNFPSFGLAAQAMKCGILGPIVLNVAAGSGPYNNDQFYLPNTVTGTSATNTITVNGNNAVMNFTGVNGIQRGAIMLNGVDYVTVNDVIVNVNSTASAYGYGVHLINGADNNTIRGCTINIDSTNTSSAFAGMVINGSLTIPTGTGTADCDSNRFLYNNVNGGYYGITCVGNATATPVYGNVLRGNVIRNSYFYGVYSLYTNGLTVDSNDISRPTRPSVSSIYGIAMSTGSVNGMVTRNRVHNMFDANLTSTGILYALYAATDATAAQPNRWVNNMVYNIRSNGSQYGIYNTSADHNLYHHNTISLDDTAYTGSALAYGVYQTTSATGIDVRNNIISVRRAGTGNKTALYFNTAATTFTSNYNDLYVTPAGGTGTNNIGFYSSAYTTLTAWQSGAGKDTASVSIDPQFTGGVTSGNLTPTNVAIDNLGQPIGVAVDAFGTARSLTTPDMGAIEWSFIPPCAAPTALTDVAAATTATISWTASTSVNVGYEYWVSTTATPPASGNNAPSSPVTETGLTAGTTYYWFVRTVCGPGSYSAWVMDSFTTCVPPASTLIAQGSPTPNAVSICQGDTAMLKAPGGTGNTYLFLLNGATAGSGASADSTFHAMQAGSYTVVVTNATGCYDTSDAVQVTVNPLPTPNITQTSYNQLTTTTTFSSYQWNLAGAPISGATSQTYTAPPTGNGTYTVTVTDANGCRATSSPYNLTTASVAAAAGAVAHIRIFPNPTTGRIFIESSEEVRAGVWTLDGRRLMEVEKAKMVDLSNLASGVYMLRLTDANGTVLATERVTKTN